MNKRHRSLSVTWASKHLQSVWSLKTNVKVNPQHRSPDATRGIKTWLFLPFRRKNHRLPFARTCCLCVSVTQVCQGKCWLVLPLDLVFATCHLSPPVPNACQHRLLGSTMHHCLSPDWPCSLLLSSLDVPQPLLEFPVLLAGHGPLLPPPSLFRPHFKPPVKPQGFHFFRQVMLPFTSAPLHRGSFYQKHPSSAALSLTVINELTLIPPSSVSFGNPVVFIRTKIYCTEWSKSKRQKQIAHIDKYIRKIPWRRIWQPTPVSLPGESHGQRSLAGYSPRGGRVKHNWVANIQHIYMEYRKMVMMNLFAGQK